jgi:hypothetical protein
MRPSPPRQAVDEPAPFERLPESLIAIGLVGEIALLVAPWISASAKRESWTLADVISACRTKPLPSSTARSAL